jgi:O-antigen/teichoic acid export membrane protein
MPYFLTAGLAIVLLPAVARAGAGATHDARALVGEALRFGVLLVTPLATLIAAGADDLVVLLYSERYEPATTALTLLGPAIGAFALVTLLATLLAGGGRTSYAILAVAGGLAVSGGVAVVAIPMFGMAGAAGATLSGAVVGLSMAIGAALSAFSVRVPWLSIVRAGAASAVVGVVALLLDGTAATLVGLPSLVLVYGALLILTREVGPRDWQRVLAFLPDGLYGGRGPSRQRPE